LILAVASAVTPSKISSCVYLIAALIGFFFAFSNGFPSSSDLMNDGANALLLFRRPASRYGFWALMKANALLAEGYSFADLPLSITEYREGETECPLLSSVALMRAERLFFSGKMSEAMPLYEALFSSRSALPAISKKLCVCKMIMFRALSSDLDTAIELMTEDVKSFMRLMKNDPTVIATEYVYRVALGDLRRAEELLERFKRVYRSYPYRGEISDLEDIMYRFATGANSNT
jgi:hypothetical protein